MAINPFQGNIALSLGSSNVYATKDAKEVYSSPSCALVNVHNSIEVTALGSEARRMEGRTAGETMLVWPVSYGGVGDCELCAMIILDACEHLTLRHRPLDKNRLILTYNDGSTKVERAALVNAAQLAGAKKITAIKAPLAACMNFGRRIDRPEAQLVVSIGKSVTEVSVISGGSVAVSRHMKTGSRAFDEAIIQQVRRKCNLVIDYQIAETLKRDMGSATQPRSNAPQQLSGRSILTGKPITATITPEDVFEAISVPVNDIVGAICDALYSLPAQFSADILKNGICLTGGGANLYGLAKRLHDDTQLEVAINDEPAFDEVRGALKLSGDDRLLRLLTEAYSAYEA